MRTRNQSTLQTQSQSPVRANNPSNRSATLPFPIELVDVSKRFVIHHERHRSFQEMMVNVFRSNRSREEFWAVRDVSFRVEQGEMLGIIGQNGSGKSTILKLITRILEPTSGTVSVAGRLAALLELGAGFHPDLTGRENIHLNGSILGLSKKTIDRKLDDIVSFAELERFIDTPIKHYSSGMYMRLAFSIAINVDPEVLLIDEILAVGDEVFQRKCLERIGGFRGECLAIVFVSHDLATVRNLCDRAIWLENGCIKAQGDSNEVVDGYLTDANKRERERAQTQDAPAEDGRAVNQWGTREVEITGVEFLDARDERRKVFETGEQLIARISYRAAKRVDTPVFGVAIFRDEGVHHLHVNGPNTRTCDFPIEYVEGEGYIDYVIPSLPLLAGAYRFSAAVYDFSCTHPYDHHDRMYTFKVQPSVKERLGVFHIPCTWRMNR